MQDPRPQKPSGEEEHACERQAVSPFPVVSAPAPDAESVKAASSGPAAAHSGQTLRGRPTPPSHLSRGTPWTASIFHLKRDSPSTSDALEK